MEVKKSMFDFIQDAEDFVSFLPGVAAALNILHEELDHNLRIRHDFSGDVDGFLRISIAMDPALAELDRIREGLDAVINAAYEQEKEGKLA